MQDCQRKPSLPDYRLAKLNPSLSPGRASCHLLLTVLSGKFWALNIPSFFSVKFSYAWQEVQNANLTGTFLLQCHVFVLIYLTLWHTPTCSFIGHWKKIYYGNQCSYDIKRHVGMGVERDWVAVKFLRSLWGSILSPVILEQLSESLTALTPLKQWNSIIVGANLYRTYRGLL